MDKDQKEIVEEVEEVEEGFTKASDEGFKHTDTAYRSNMRTEGLKDILEKNKKARDEVATYEEVEVEEEEPVVKAEKVEPAKAEPAKADPGPDPRVIEAQKQAIAETVRELAERERRVAEAELKLKAAPPVDMDAVREKARKALTRLNGYDPEDEDVEAFAELAAIQVSQQPQSNFTQADIERQVQASLKQAEFKRDLEAAQKQFRQDNQDIADVPERRSVAAAFSQQLRNSKPDLSISENLAEAAKMARSYLGLEKKIETESGDMQDRVSRKRAATEQVPTSAKAGHKTPAAPRPLTRSEQVNEMRKRRGQPII